jgi:hypothetical protein
VSDVGGASPGALSGLISPKKPTPSASHRNKAINGQWFSAQLTHFLCSSFLLAVDKNLSFLFSQHPRQCSWTIYLDFCGWMPTDTGGHGS